MTTPARFWKFLSILALGILACSVSVDLGLPKTIPQDALPTIVAQTLQAMTQQAILAMPSSTPLPTATATVTNTPVPPTLSVSAATDCYAGPSRQYGFVITIRPGTVVKVVGQDVADNYWIIDVPGYPGTVCWLSGQYALLSGDTAHLPAPATPQPSLYTLSEPRNLRVSCSYEDLSDDDDDDDDWDHDKSLWNVVFRWTNTEPDQSAVRVYRNSWLLATLGPRASSYTDSFVQRHRHHDVTYGVQAVKGRYVSSIVTIEVRHCD